MRWKQKPNDAERIDARAQKHQVYEEEVVWLELRGRGYMVYLVDHISTMWRQMIPIGEETTKEACMEMGMGDRLMQDQMLVRRLEGLYLGLMTICCLMSRGCRLLVKRRAEEGGVRGEEEEVLVEAEEAVSEVVGVEVEVKGEEEVREGETIEVDGAKEDKGISRNSSSSTNRTSHKGRTTRQDFHPVRNLYNIGSLLLRIPRHLVKLHNRCSTHSLSRNNPISHSNRTFHNSLSSPASNPSFPWHRRTDKHRINSHNSTSPVVLHKVR